MASKLKRFPIKMVVFGPPGVGKGVYTKLMERDLKVKAFSTGDYIREVLKTKVHAVYSEQDLMNLEAKVKAGELLSNDIVNKIVDPVLSNAKKDGILLDGYPRTLLQAKYLSSHLQLDVVFNLDLREDILIRKLLGRRVCPSCKKSFNIEDVNEDEYKMPPMLPKHPDPTTCDCCPNIKLI